jgi:hypothetical protein
VDVGGLAVQLRTLASCHPGVELPSIRQDRMSAEDARRLDDYYAALAAKYGATVVESPLHVVGPTVRFRLMRVVHAGYREKPHL